MDRSRSECVHLRCSRDSCRVGGWLDGRLSHPKRWPQLGGRNATLPTLSFKPGIHVNYAETVLPMRDGLPKMKDFPKEFGGSGETMAE